MDDTAQMVFRKLWPTEAGQLERHLLRLRREDRLLRFGRPVGDESIRGYCAETDWMRTIVLGGFVGGQMRAAGEIKLLDGHWPPRAEIAITVEGPFQDKGVGTRVLRRLIVIARNRFVERIYMICMADNRRMQRIARKFGTILVFSDSQVEGQIVPPFPDAWSMFGEAAEDALAFAQSAANSFLGTALLRPVSGLGLSARAARTTEL
jgi:RimJ/RimL family protein N-acetyltransferase